MLIRQPKNVLTVTATTSIRILDKLLSSSFYSSIPWWNTPTPRTILTFELRVPFLRVVQKNSRQNTMRLWHHPGFKWVPSIKVCVLLLFNSILALDYWSEKWCEWVIFPWKRDLCLWHHLNKNLYSKLAEVLNFIGKKFRFWNVRTSRKQSFELTQLPISREWVSLTSAFITDYTHHQITECNDRDKIWGSATKKACHQSSDRYHMKVSVSWDTFSINTEYLFAPFAPDSCVSGPGHLTNWFDSEFRLR